MGARAFGSSVLLFPVCKDSSFLLVSLPPPPSLSPPVSVSLFRSRARSLSLSPSQVSPPYDTTGATAILAANLLYEMLCVLPGVPRRK